jgi:hypothetical protein
MINPWNAVLVPNDNYAHGSDRLAWDAPVRLPPQPYLGSFTNGRVMWLLGGFGTGPNMAMDYPVLRPKVLAWVKQNLAGDLPDTPNLWLGAGENDPIFLQTRDVCWWRKATSFLFKAMAPIVGEGESRVVIAEGLFVLEAFPYPAKVRPNLKLPTHE